MGLTAIEVDSLVGAESEEAGFEVERGAIRKFAEALGDPEPAYRRGEIAPLTFPTTFRIPVPGLTVDPARFLHGEQEFLFTRPIRAGDRLRCKRRVVDVYERAGRLGRMTFVVSEMEGRDESGAHVFTDRSVVIVR